MYVAVTNNAVSLKAYRDIFNYEFNISFFKPKNRNPTQFQQEQYQLHRKNQDVGYAQRNADRSRVKGPNVKKK